MCFKIRIVSGHDRGTLWVACRKNRKINVGFSPCGLFFGKGC